MMWIDHNFLNVIQYMACRYPSLGLMTKARGCKVISQKRKLDNEKKCEGMNPHTPKGAPTLGIGVQWTIECLESDCKGQNPMD